MREDTVRASLSILARDLKRLLRSPVALLVTLGVCLIPSAYAWLNILANWDPYENTGTVPVAVVVEDVGADVPGLGEVNAGQMIQERLEQNHQLAWTFVDEQEALEGVDAGRYYAAFVIPADFTSTLAGVVEGDAQPARVSYYVNEKVNAVSPKVTDTGATTLENQISSEFMSVAGETVTERVQDAVRPEAAATGEAAGNVSRPFPQAVVANQVDAPGCYAAEIQSWPESGIAARRQAIASDPYAEKKGCVSLSFIDELAASPAQTHRAVVMCRNRFFEGETLEVLSPGRGVFTVQPTRLVWHAADDASPDDVERRREGVLAGADPRVVGGTLCAVNVANRTMETYSFDCGEELRAGDILRVLRTDQCEGRTIE